MFKRSYKQALIKSIISWVLTVLLAIYYVYLHFYTAYSITLVHIVLVVFCGVYSFLSTVSAFKRNEKGSSDDIDGNDEENIKENADDNTDDKETD